MKFDEKSTQGSSKGAQVLNLITLSFSLICKIALVDLGLEKKVHRPIFSNVMIVFFCSTKEGVHRGKWGGGNCEEIENSLFQETQK